MLRRCHEGTTCWPFSGKCHPFSCSSAKRSRGTGTVCLAAEHAKRSKRRARQATSCLSVRRRCPTSARGKLLAWLSLEQEAKQQSLEIAAASFLRSETSFARSSISIASPSSPCCCDGNSQTWWPSFYCPHCVAWRSSATHQRRVLHLTHILPETHQNVDQKRPKPCGCGPSPGVYARMPSGRGGSTFVPAQDETTTWIKTWLPTRWAFLTLPCFTSVCACQCTQRRSRNLARSLGKPRTGTEPARPISRTLRPLRPLGPLPGTLRTRRRAPAPPAPLSRCSAWRGCPCHLASRSLGLPGLCPGPPALRWARRAWLLRHCTACTACTARPHKPYLLLGLCVHRATARLATLSAGCGRVLNISTSEKKTQAPKRSKRAPRTGLDHSRFDQSACLTRSYAPLPSRTEQSLPAWQGAGAWRAEGSSLLR